MKFSIIIPTLNEQENIRVCLLPLQVMRSEAEIILVDGGSDDNTVMYAKRLVDKTFRCGSGRAKQMNVGAHYAEGEILIFLHADTALPDKALALINQHITSKQCWGRFDIALTGGHWMLPVIASMMNWRSRLTGIATGDQVIFVTRTAFNKVNGYPSIALMEDICLCKKLKTLGSPLCLSAKVRSSARRWLQSGVFKTIFLMWSLRLGYFFGTHPDTLALLYKKGQYCLPDLFHKTCQK